MDDRYLAPKWFKRYYNLLMDDLGFSQNDDIKSRDLLRDIMLSKKGYNLDAIIEEINIFFSRFNKILIFGGGVDSRKFLEKIQDSEITNFKSVLSNQFLVIAIDGSTKLLHDFGIIPGLIFTDLDGITPELVNKTEFSKTFFIIHAHGDNLDKILLFKNFIENHPKIIGSTQNESNPPVMNYGGFTDGDRSLFFLKNFIRKNMKIYLLGFDFTDVVGSHSKPDRDEDFMADEVKRKKLYYGKSLIEKITENNKDWRIYTVEIERKGMLKLPKIKNLDEIFVIMSK